MAVALETSPLLDVKDLTLRFGGLVAVRDVSFTVRQGEITGLIGPNGAGKTTIFNCLTGFYKPDSGRIFCHRSTGSPLALERMADFRVVQKARIVRTFQNIRLFAGMTVLENLLVACHNGLVRHSPLSLAALFGLSSWRQAEKAALDMCVHHLERVGLRHRADDLAGSLSYGDQRRLEIARALCLDPVLLCLDEPAAGLNPRESAELADLLRSLRTEGVSLFLIEHDMAVVMGICDRILVLEQGIKIAEGSPKDIRENPRVIAAYLGVEDKIGVENKDSPRTGEV
jgi:branched-chain amino acid transport system ATP-binding protein